MTDQRSAVADEPIPRSDDGGPDWHTYAAIKRSSITPEGCARLREQLVGTPTNPTEIEDEYDVQRRVLSRHARGECSCGSVHDTPPLERDGIGGVWVVARE